MPKIDQYNLDTSMANADTLIGTDGETGLTKKFNAQAIANNFNDTGKIGIGGQLNFIFKTVVSPRADGTITFANGSGEGTAFSAITDLVISKENANEVNVTEYLQFLASTDVTEVFIFQLDNTNNFGNYTITSLTDRTGETDFFDAQLTFLAGNGSLIDTKAYGITKGTSNVDKTFVHTQSSASSTWSITHNLGKFPSVSIVDSAENLVLGDVTYINNNSLTISFSATFSGKAYIN